ncbi:MAG: hypothetical protein MI747_08980 [Desulfobacterales bacterium]|nr:hypothetical protein [Desulfobacterales bacterium]
MGTLEIRRPLPRGVLRLAWLSCLALCLILGISSAMARDLNGESPRAMDKNMNMGPDLQTITPEALRDRLPGIAILDGRPAKDYGADHIQTAHSFDWKAHTAAKSAPIPYRLHPPDRLARALTRAGIRNHDPVVVYGQGKKDYGGEGWAVWVLAYLGHTGPIHILQGGFTAWKERGYPLDRADAPRAIPQAHPPYRYKINGSVMALKSQMDPATAYLVDTRSHFERMGSRLPGSIHIPWTAFFDQDGRSPLPGPDLEALLHSRGIGKDKPVIYYCTGGIRSGWSWLVHTLSGYSPALNFEGGTAAY